MKLSCIPGASGRARALSFSLIAAATLFLAADAALAQVIVVQSSAPELKAGELLEGGTKVSIPTGKQAVFVLPSGATRTVAGPFEGTADALGAGQREKSDVFDAVKRYVVTGGTSARNVGAVRSATTASFTSDVPFSWNLVPLTASGDLCLLKGSKVALARPGKGATLNVTVVDTKQNRRVQTAFLEDAKTVPWPDEIELEAGRSYVLLVPDRNPREIRIRLISKEPERDETLQLLHRERCDSQFRAWLRVIQTVALQQ